MNKAIRVSSSKVKLTLSEQTEHKRLEAERREEQDELEELVRVKGDLPINKPLISPPSKRSLQSAEKWKMMWTGKPHHVFLTFTS